MNELGLGMSFSPSDLAATIRDHFHMDGMVQAAVLGAGRLLFPSDFVGAPRGRFDAGMMLSLANGFGNPWGDERPVLTHTAVVPTARIDVNAAAAMPEEVLASPTAVALARVTARHATLTWRPDSSRQRGTSKC